MNASLQRLKDKLPRMDELSARLFNGLIKVESGEITHAQFKDGLKKLFAPEMTQQWDLWMKEVLFRCQRDTRLESFLTRSKEDVDHDRYVWYKFEHLAFLTEETDTEPLRLRGSRGQRPTPTTRGGSNQPA